MYKLVHEEDDDVLEKDEKGEEDGDKELSIETEVSLHKVDDVLSSFGGIGKFQVQIFLIATLMTCVACWRILLDLFAVKYCPWECTELGLSMNCTDSELAGILPCDVPGNAGLDQDGDAEGKYWQYDANQSRNSIVSTFGLPCNETWKFSFTSSIYFIGAFFGVLILGLLSDRIGRYKTLLISLALCVVPAWVMPFISNINIYLACRFFEGAAFGGYFMVMFVLTMEYCPPNQRAKLGTLIHLLASIAMATIAVYGYLFRRLNHYTIALAVAPTLAIVIVFFAVPESPRWLLGKGRHKEALALLQAVADRNGCEMPKNVQLYEDAGVKGGFKDIVKNWKLVRSTLINMFGWFLTSLVYYMLWFGAKYLSGNIYLNAFVLGMAELPGRVAAYFLMEKLGRKRTFMMALALACVVMMVSIYEDPTTRKVMYCIGKTITGAMWAVIYIYTTEIYPTNVRGLGAGIGSGAARVAAFLAPFVGEVGKLGTAVPYVIVAVLAVACISVFWMLPETKGKDLPQTLDEFEGLFAKNKRIDKEKEINND